MRKTKKKAPSHMTPRAMDRMLMGLQLDEQFEAINLPLRVRKGSLRLTYIGHHPKLWVKTPNSEPECVAYLNTRSSQLIPCRPADANNLALCNHLFQSMDKVQCVIALVYDIDPKTQRKRVRLQIRSPHARTSSHTLHWIFKGEQSHWMDEFVIENHPLKPDVIEPATTAV